MNKLKNCIIYNYGTQILHRHTCTVQVLNFYKLKIDSSILVLLIVHSL